MRSPNRVKHMMLVLWHLRDGGSLEIRDLGLSENDKKRNGGGRKTRGKTTVVVGKHGENTLKTVEPPKKRGRTANSWTVGCLFGKVRYTLSPAGKTTSAAEERSIGIQGRGVLGGPFLMKVKIGLFC